MLYYIFVYILQLQSTRGVSGFGVHKTAGMLHTKALIVDCRSVHGRKSLRPFQAILYSSQEAGHTVGQVILKEHLLFMVLTTRGQNKEAPHLWVLSLYVRLRAESISAD